jgi:hypothetical protein
MATELLVDVLGDLQLPWLSDELSMALVGSALLILAALVRRMA